MLLPNTTKYQAVGAGSPSENEKMGVLSRGLDLAPARPATFAHGRPRNKHLALLGGLLYCDSCVARMVYSYSRKNDRQYHYYVCLNAQRQGWAACPAKSLPAAAIEESVLKRLRDAQPERFGALKWEHLDRARQVEAIQALVERVGYDAAARRVSIRFRPVKEEVPA